MPARRRHRVLKACGRVASTWGARPDRSHGLTMEARHQESMLSVESEVRDANLANARCASEPSFSFSRFSPHIRPPHFTTWRSKLPCSPLGSTINNRDGATVATWKQPFGHQIKGETVQHISMSASTMICGQDHRQKHHQLCPPSVLPWPSPLCTPRYGLQRRDRLRREGSGRHQHH